MIVKRRKWRKPNEQSSEQLQPAGFFKKNTERSIFTYTYVCERKHHLFMTNNRRDTSQFTLRVKK